MEELKQLLKQLEADGIYLDGFSRIRSRKGWYLVWNLRACEFDVLDEFYNTTSTLVDINLNLDGEKDEVTMDWRDCSDLNPCTVANIVKLANILKEMYS